VKKNHPWNAERRGSFFNGANPPYEAGTLKLITRRFHAVGAQMRYVSQGRVSLGAPRVLCNKKAAWPRFRNE